MLRKAIKKVLPTLASIAVVAAYPLSTLAFTPTSNGAGDFADEKISGEAATVFMVNHYGTYKKCTVDISYWGKLQTGNVKFDCFCADYGIQSHTFKGIETYPVFSTTYTHTCNWTLDAQCTALTSHRTISGSWVMN